MKISCSTIAKMTIALILTIGVLTPSAFTQEMAKKDAPPKPALSPSQAVLDSWNDIGRKLIAMAEDFPEDKYDFKPTPAQRSFAEQLLHATGANYFLPISLWVKSCPQKKTRSVTSTKPKQTWLPS